VTATHVEQQLPIPNDKPSIQALVREDLEQREQVGIGRYGTALQPNNGRDALRDAYEEALDLVCYLRQVIEERRLQAERNEERLAVLVGQHCKSCPAEVIWAETEQGRATLVDAAPDPDGSVDVLARAGRSPLAVVVAEGERGGKVLRLSHFATCPGAEAHRRSR
jgi:hypothetical protein